jgi:hypothetical protein
MQGCKPEKLWRPMAHFLYWSWAAFAPSYEKKRAARITIVVAVQYDRDKMPR